MSSRSDSHHSPALHRAKLALAVAAALCCAPLEARPADDDAVLELPSMGDDSVLDLPTIVVTGSHIRRSDTEGPSSVQIIGQQEIERSGAATVTELFRDVPYSTAGVRDETFSQGPAAGSAAIDLRGLGVNRTLVLLDGRRLPLFPFGGGEQGTASFVDVNTIPLGALDRVEILKDGASAIYGSDAIAGVVNMMSVKEFDGARVSIDLGQTDKGDGQEARLTALGGITGERYNLTAGIDYFHREDVMARDRRLTRSAIGPTPRGAREPVDNRSLTSNPGWTVAPGAPRPDPRCPDSRVVELAPGATACVEDFAPWVTLIPRVDRLGATLSGDYAITDSVSVFLRAIYSHSESERDLAPIGTVPGEELFIAPDNPTNIYPGDLTVAYRRFHELGPRRDEFRTDFYNIVAGVNGMIGTWQWELAGSYGDISSTQEGVSGYATEAAMQTAVDDARFNVFSSNPDFNRGRVAYKTKRRGTSIQRAVDFKTDGEVVQLPAGPLMAAIGLEYRNEHFSDRKDRQWATGAVYGLGGLTASGDRDVKTAFVELSAPLHETLEVQLAGRYDNYSDFGTTINPKLGVRWQPLSNLLLRASGGTGFKAPSLGELYASVDPAAANFEAVVDPTTGQPVQVLNYAGGNPDLDAEESTNFSLGLVWDILDGWDFSADGWYIKNEDAITTQSAQYFVDNEGAYPGTVIRDETTGRILEVNSAYQNIAAQRLWGIDLETNVRWTQEGYGDFHWRLVAAYLGNFEEEPVPGAGYQKLAGRDGRPMWRWLSSFWWTRGELDAGLVLNYIGSYDRLAARSVAGVDPRVDSYATVDAQLNWTPAALRGGRITLGIDNLFDELPPEDPYYEFWPWFNRDLYSARGRFLYARYSHAF